MCQRSWLVRVDRHVGLKRALLVLGLVAGATSVMARGQTARPSAAPVLVFETVKGTFEIETLPNHAPKTVAYITALVTKRFYNGLRVHRVEPKFVVQFGDPQTRDMTKKELWGRGGSGSTIGLAEISKTLKHTVGTASIAHRGDASQGDSQIFIVTGPAAHVDGKYAIFGRVTSGMDAVQRLAVDDRIIRATVKGAQ